MRETSWSSCCCASGAGGWPLSGGQGRGLGILWGLLRILARRRSLLVVLGRLLLIRRGLTNDRGLGEGEDREGQEDQSGQRLVEGLHTFASFCALCAFM